MPNRELNAWQISFQDEVYGNNYGRGEIDIIKMLSINIIGGKKGLPLEQTNDKKPDCILLPDDGETYIEIAKIQFFFIPQLLFHRHTNNYLADCSWCTCALNSAQFWAVALFSWLILPYIYLPLSSFSLTSACP